MSEGIEWRIQPITAPPDGFVQWVEPFLPESVRLSRASGQAEADRTLPSYAAQLLWQRGIREREQLLGFLDPQFYQPTSPFAFGSEMTWAVNRLSLARQQAERVAIWGDFDADGVTATAVLWEGLGEFFPPQQLTYWIPNRFTDSHGLSLAGLQALSQQGVSLIVTGDTGSSHSAEIQQAQALGIDLIVTDHHTLPSQRPPVIALINPRSLPADHPLAHLSGVAVAYKLIEALYQTLPNVPHRPLSNLLDLVAIGLIADLVNLTGDCRYLAQQGMLQLQKNLNPIDPPRPGIAKLLELCRRSGDRPSDITFGLGPRINAISRIQGDAHFAVELLTSTDRQRTHQLALETELANARRKALQRQVMQQAQEKLAQLDLSTTCVIVLADPQWPIGILGLVAGQLAQLHNRPAILLSTETSPSPLEGSPETALFARGSARSPQQINLYDLLQPQSHLLHHFGGHPLALGLSLPVENIPLLTQALNQTLRLQAGSMPPPTVQADLIVQVAALGKTLFQELRLLEPYGMGNPVPRLLIQNTWFRKTWHRNLKDLTGRKLDYIKTEFELWDDSCTTGFPGIWWGHYKDELPTGRCDVLVELDFNSYEDTKHQPHYEVRLVALRPATPNPLPTTSAPLDWILDWRSLPQPSLLAAVEARENSDDSQVEARNAETNAQGNIFRVMQCPSSWDELGSQLRQAQQAQCKLALAYAAPMQQDPAVLWQRLVNLAASLSLTQALTTRVELQQQLGMGARSLEVGLQALAQMGLSSVSVGPNLQFQQVSPLHSEPPERSDQGMLTAIEQFNQAAQEEQFRRQYFYQAPLSVIQSVAEQLIS